ncbi:phage terminase small subunit-related protein [Empedobacter sp.]|uniref:phage terminase small subunit-related protein n=1 Tax=Empedobacter sp. TaxID=1927715 RepID=UPI00289B688A|nr:phage terminase small subunit-related protein [Empedobacter sp.]
MASTKTNKGGRMTSAERDYKRSEAKKLYVLGLALLNISEIIGVGEKTLRNWKELDNWEEEKDISSIKPSEIKKMILQYVLDVKNGITPRYKADDLSKVVAAWDRMDDYKKKVVNAMETFDEFADDMMLVAGQSTGKKREETLNNLKVMRPYFDKYITKLLSEND